ncbi:hypothetical protein [Lentzea sp. CC55]|uniref:hypothetical protein n=1 Tax=Lentzea sp. CC55 TaxID=2884909 RepID=UPI001F3F75E5|nr:hypothetical protein [Lentzea sp. CC55]MCG8927173.1 hypothetical protein [Lentzea sp. CC55]
MREFARTAVLGGVVGAGAAGQQGLEQEVDAGEQRREPLGWCVVQVRHDPGRVGRGGAGVDPFEQQGAARQVGVEQVDHRAGAGPGGERAGLEGGDTEVGGGA